MDTKKLDAWAKKLLDTNKNNNLINFRDRKTSTVEILCPSADSLLDKIGSTEFEVFDPHISENEDDVETIRIDEMLTSQEPEEKDRKTAYMERYADKLKKQNQILLYSTKASPITCIKNIDKKARAFMDETGVNVAYIAFGFIHWRESEFSNDVILAPVLLVPVQLHQETGADPYQVKAAEDDIIVNPTFAYKLDAEYGIKLPEYCDEGLIPYLEKVRKTVSNLRWQVSDECKLGIFSFSKINMYRDLKDNAKKILENRNIQKLLGEPAGDIDDNDISEETHVENPLITLHSVVDADSSQIEAIEMAKSGKSFVLQGPPGTGKSQTITNIIAECLGDGKKVLFVSEKLAALNVVYEKLNQAGLSEFCLELHSHKANKKDVIADICHTLRENGSVVSAKAEREVEIKERAMKQLDSYATELHRQRPVIDMSLYELYERYAALENVPDVNWVVPGLKSKGESFLSDGRIILEQYVDYIPSIGYSYQQNPWYGYINQGASFQEKVALKHAMENFAGMLEALIHVQQNLFDKCGINCGSVQSARDWRDFFKFAGHLESFARALLERKRYEETKKILPEIKALSNEIKSHRNVIAAICDDSIYDVDGVTYHNKLTKQFKGTFSRLFNAEYGKIVGDIRLAKKDGKKPSYSEAVGLSERLAYCQQQTSKFENMKGNLPSILENNYKGIYTDWDSVESQLVQIGRIFDAGETFGNLADKETYDREKNEFPEISNEIDHCFELCEKEDLEYIDRCFDANVVNINTFDCKQLLEKCQRCLAEFDKIDNWNHFRNLLSDLDEKGILPFVDLATVKNLESKYFVKAFEKQFYYQWIDSILSASEVLSSFNRISQDKAVSVFSKTDTEQFEINKAVIRAELSAKRPSIDMVAAGSSLAILLREGEKKRKQKSIRKLLTETGEMVQRIKPCFLMSPLSVSTFLDPESIHFDVVVFDEASQIFPQDAVGAIYRADQAVVVGDSKQMPPSNFFKSVIDTDDEEEETGDVSDFESILDICKATMKQVRLRWHYRSRYEQLITFSNRNFYDGELVTFPSAVADMPGVGVDYFHVDSVFDRQTHTNRKEANFIVELIYKNIEKYPNRSLGVVAFSKSQQNLIDNLLAKKRQITPEKEFFFKNNRKEPFFVKNLETVQGDERDTIIFSVAYGVDAQGRLFHNFGPLNRMGGERRLNVAVTRAKCNVQIVSSMHYTDIDLNRTSAEGARLLREYLDFAENGEIALDRAVSVSEYDQFDSDFELEVCEFLRSRGFSVDTQVGCSGFKIDLGLKQPNSSNYVLAIECDGATYHSSKNARDRDRLRQEILERMGWKFYRIWSTDWFKNKAIEKQRLCEAALNALSSTPTNAPKPETIEEADCFEEVSPQKSLEFPEYKVADIKALRRKYLPHNFRGMVRAILEVEAPLSEELLLRRIVDVFKREKVTNAVWKEYDRKMLGCQRYGIIRRGEFLYLDGQTDIHFRRPGDLTREVKHIAMEELADGMMAILKENMCVDKNGLYHALAAQCGLTRVGKTVSEHFDRALMWISNAVTINGDQISIKQ